MRYANTLWAARMRYATCEYAMGRANAMRYANRLRARYADTPWAARM